MSEEAGGWQIKPLPERKVLRGRYVQLEPMNAATHAESLYNSISGLGVEDRFFYLFDDPPESPEALYKWAEKASASEDPLYFAVVDQADERTLGRVALMRIKPEHGVIEIGSILWGRDMARTRKATEAFFLIADYVFSLGYRRLEWKCDDANQASKAAARRFGFSYEGLFRQHMVVKRRNRDTAWFSITDRDWQSLGPGFEWWLQPDNFDEQERQLSRLTFAS